jgi:TonB family protein
MMLIGSLAFAIMVCAVSATAQAVAILTPNGTPLDKSLAEQTRAALTGAFRVQDLELSQAAFAASSREASAFNMTAIDAREVASVLGCDFFILIKTGSQRRASIDKADYVESFAAFYVVSGRTGRLIKWQLVSEKGADEKDAEHRLTQGTTPLTFLFDPISAVWKTERNEPAIPKIEVIPDEGSTAAKNFRSPLPYMRLKPEYTKIAYLYDVTATVEATVDLDEKGRITRLEITRWAGYGLDESVIKAVRSMNWRPAERGGKPLPIRFLLRYNFKKIEKDDIDNE